MKLKIIFPLAFMLLLSACQTTQVTTGYYDVRGTTSKEIDRSIKKNGPLKGHAIASAEISFKPTTLTFKENSQTCQVSKAKLQVIAKITLPRWLSSSQSSSSLRRGVRNLQDYAKWHEKQHVKIAEAAAKSMERGLLDIKPQKTCKALERKIKKFFKRALVIHEKAQNKFDAIENKRLNALAKQGA